VKFSFKYTTNKLKPLNFSIIKHHKPQNQHVTLNIGICICMGPHSYYQWSFNKNIQQIQDVLTTFTNPSSSSSPIAYSDHLDSYLTEPTSHNIGSASGSFQNDGLLAGAGDAAGSSTSDAKFGFSRLEGRIWRFLSIWRVGKVVCIGRVLEKRDRLLPETLNEISAEGFFVIWDFWGWVPIWIWEIGRLIKSLGWDLILNLLNVLIWSSIRSMKEQRRRLTVARRQLLTVAGGRRTCDGGGGRREKVRVLDSISE